MGSPYDTPALPPAARIRFSQARSCTKGNGNEVARRNEASRNQAEGKAKTGMKPQAGSTGAQERDTTEPQPHRVRADRIRGALHGRAIVLVGLMGAGKSSIGRRLADRLRLPFIDADTAIEEAAGMTIPEIFKIHGEAHFRDGERRVIGRLLQTGEKVLATGGGAFMNPETREAVAASGISVWLRADLDTLMRRVRKRSNRPLLQTADPEQVMRKLMEDRYPVYAASDIAVESREVPHDQIVSEVLLALEQFLATAPDPIPAFSSADSLAASPLPEPSP
jgi:shikimate kinase